MSRPEEPNVLVVEDDPDLREALVDLLAANHVSVNAVRDGEQAVYYLMLESRPDLILLDLRLPSLNGWDFLEWLRTQPDLGTIPVAILSGAPTEYVELTETQEPLICLTKPVDPEVLLAIVDELRHPFR
jgi:CheY-like chemotaxis protein